MTCKHVTFGAAASLMVTLVLTSVGLLFSAPGTAADKKPGDGAWEIVFESPTGQSAR